VIRRTVPATSCRSVPAGDKTIPDELRAIWAGRAARPGRSEPAATLGGRRVLTLESRRSPELALLVMNYGGTPILAPSLSEVPLASNGQVLAFADGLRQGRFDMVILLTGVGLRLMIKVIDPVLGAGALARALAPTRIVARGPKPVAALREIGLEPWATAPTPNTWRELIATLDERAGEAPLGGARLAVQEYGAPNRALEDALVSRGAEVLTVPVYKWALPEDLAPLRRAVWCLVRHEVDIVILTASVQLVHLLRVGADMGLEPALREALGRTVVASIGPMTTEELRQQGLPVDFEPSQPKMGFLVKGIAEHCEALLEAKRRVESTTRGLIP
jgi:uroporphyrinogen-III synthase